MASTSLCRSIFITGCNRGLGLEFVKQFLKLSPPPEHIFATCRDLNAKSCEELKQLASENSNVCLVELDVTEFERIKGVAQEVSDKLQGKGLNVLLNNAGIIFREPSIEDVTVEMMVDHYKVNTVAPLMITQAFLPLLKKAATDPEEKSYIKAAVLNMSSLVGSLTNYKKGVRYPYRASKSALNSVTKSMSVDLKPFGIISVVLDPGWVRTDMGGEQAPLAASESVSGMMEVIKSLDESKNGMWLDYKGDITPW
ncbi:uncharacterized protein LOC116290338 [Actinia tenebrosa]|uniref:Uncharacterized protein LOC116290338 n=1 Tax=Actinia tenebrosa TaxID=6105 RepID=A0A6P8HKI7_ACTTE|nr:uncharacterized protein LOC116290338 [Actinia tenebrosa]